MDEKRLDALLRQASDPESEKPPHVPSPRLVEDVLTAVKVRQVRRRRLVTTLLATTAYLGGLATMWLIGPESGGEVADAHRITKATRDTEPDGASAADEQPGQLTQEVAELPQSRKSLYQFYRDLRDASHQRGDVGASVRYYRLAVNSASERELEPADSLDNLVLLSMKQDKLTGLHPSTQEDPL